MGGQTRTTQEQQPIISPGEAARTQRLNERDEFLDPQIRDVQSQGLQLVESLLSGGLQGGAPGLESGLPGFLAGLPGGISPEVTQQIAEEGIRTARPSLQAGGLLDSGVEASVLGRIAGDTGRQSAQFNLQNLSQLLQLAVGGQAQVQQPILGFGQQLSNSLAGARGLRSTGTQSNPSFGQTFGQSFANSLGSGFGGSPQFGFGGGKGASAGFGTNNIFG